MSRYSGKCDLCDHIEGTAGWYDKDGNSRKFNDPDYRGPLYGDELADFEAFKKATNGTLYQHKLIKVTEINQDLVAKYCEAFKVIEHKKKKLFGGTITKYTYEYYNRSYNSLKKLNKLYGGIYITTEIHFDTLIELIPYYPYLVSMCCCSDGKQTVYISDRSYAEAECDSMLQHGIDGSRIAERSRKDLAEHLEDVILKYSK